LNDPITIGAVLAVLIAALGYLLARKDEAQAKEITELRTSSEAQATKQKETNNLLFQKHDQDVAALQDLRIQIAEGHYKKTELDQRFQRLEDTFEKGMDALGKKLDKMTDILVDHIQKEDAQR
jgi:type III secretory pathway component EscV